MYIYVILLWFIIAYDNFTVRSTYSWIIIWVINGIIADELALLLHVGDDIVDRGLRAGAAGGGDGNRENGAVLGGGDALKGAHVIVLGVVDNDADALAGVHGGAAADGDHEVGAALAVGVHTVLDVLNGGVGLDIGVELEGDAVLLEQIGDLLRDAELDQIGVRGDKGLLQALALDDARDLVNGAVAVVGNAIEYKAIDRHGWFSFRICVLVVCVSPTVIIQTWAGFIKPRSVNKS